MKDKNEVTVDLLRGKLVRLMRRGSQSRLSKSFVGWIA